MHEAAEYRVLRTREELAAIAPQWSALWRHDAHATPFQSPEWLLPWARQFARRNLRTIAIEQRGRLIGLLPFYIHVEPRRQQRQLLPLGVSTTDYLDGIFSAACTPDHIANALRLLFEPRDWATAHIPQLRRGSRLLRVLRASGGRLSSSASCSRMPARPLSDLPQKIRRNAMYYRNRAQRLGSLQFSLAGESNCLDYFNELRELHTARWRQAGQPGVLADPRVLAHHRESLPRLAHAGLLRLSALRLNGETLAVLYALADPPSRPSRTLYVYLPGFSLSRADLRPGTLMLAYAMDTAAREGMRNVDLLRGDEPYKRIWHAETAPTYAVAMPSARAA